MLSHDFKHVGQKMVIALSLLITLTVELYAVPAYPGKIAKVQPDGSEITVRMVGDEFVSWLRDDQGYAIVLNEKTGYYVYAELGEDGKLAPTKAIVGVDDPADSGLERGITPDLSAASIAHSEYQKSFTSKSVTVKAPTNPNHGTTVDKNLVLLVAFNDHYDSTNRTVLSDYGRPREEYDALFNNDAVHFGVDEYGATPGGSVRDYWIYNTYGQHVIESTVVEWIKLPGDESTYGGDGDAARMAFEALNRLEARIYEDGEEDIDISEFDYITVVHSGWGHEAGYAGPIHSHKGPMAGSNFDWIWTSNYSGKIFSQYCTVPALRGTSDNNLVRIGVIVHELGHLIMGFPDLYDTNNFEDNFEDVDVVETLGVGNWCVMAGGSWGFTSDAYPSHLCAPLKYKEGYIKPVVLNREAASITEDADGRRDVENQNLDDDNPLAQRVNPDALTELGWGAYNINASAVDENAFYLIDLEPLGLSFRTQIADAEDLDSAYGIMYNTLKLNNANDRDRVRWNDKDLEVLPRESISFVGGESGSGFFRGGLVSGLPFDTGMAFSTGNLENAIGPNAGRNMSTSNGAGRNTIAGLESLIRPEYYDEDGNRTLVDPYYNCTYNAAGISFDLVGAVTQFDFNCVIATEEINFKDIVAVVIDDEYGWVLSSDSLTERNPFKSALKEVHFDTNPLNYMADLDGDGIFDVDDPDADGDGIIDTEDDEIALKDMDGDGILDNLDPDADGDNILDGVLFDVNTGLISTIYEDVDGDYLIDSEDIDGDGHLDLYDEDVDGDGRLDVDELTAGYDVDGDGNLDVDEDLDGDGHLDVAEDADRDGVLDTNEDIDGDGLLYVKDGDPEILFVDMDFDGIHDWIDPDVDGDLILDAPLYVYNGTDYVFACPTEDLDGDLYLDVNEDLDNDGLLSVSEDINGDGIFNWDEDFNGNAYLDRDEDLDGDGVLDLAGWDTDGDGELDLLSEDIDGDGLLGTFDEDVDGDGNLDVNEDVDGDGKLDVDEDLDGDGVLDIDEDVDGDGNLDVDEDFDGDGNLDVNEDVNDNGILDIGEDLDGDGNLDVDEDLDGDGNLDINEDVDGDGKLDVDEDIDGDGVLDIDEDVDEDGNLDVYEDINGDGELTLITEDQNLDGTIDYFEDFNGNGFLDTDEDYDGDGLLGTVNEDINGNGIADFGTEDYDGDGHLDVDEVAAGYDVDGDGKMDIDEDTNGNGVLDVSEDIDGDGILDRFEDVNGNGVLDTNEDLNGNFMFDAGEDINGNGLFDIINEDVNGNGIFDTDEDLNANGVFDEDEDLNGNGLFDTHEDLNGNTVFDAGEDLNGNGKFDCFELDLNFNGMLDTYDEDWNNNGILDNNQGVDEDGNPIFVTYDDGTGNLIVIPSEDVNNDGFLNVVFGCDGNMPDFTADPNFPDDYIGAGDPDISFPDEDGDGINDNIDDLILTIIDSEYHVTVEDEDLQNLVIDNRRLADDPNYRGAVQGGSNIEFNLMTEEMHVSIDLLDLLPLFLDDPDVSETPSEDTPYAYDYGYDSILNGFIDKPGPEESDLNDFESFMARDYHNIKIVVADATSNADVTNNAVTGDTALFIRFGTLVADTSVLDVPFNEFLLIENRAKTQPFGPLGDGYYYDADDYEGFEFGMPGDGGLAIWHYDDSIVWNNSIAGYPGLDDYPYDGKHHRIALVQADNQYELEKNIYGNQATDLFGTYNNTINSFTTPNTNAYKYGCVSDTHVSISNISEPGNFMSFIFMETGVYNDNISRPVNINEFAEFTSDDVEDNDEANWTLGAGSFSDQWWKYPTAVLEQYTALEIPALPGSHPRNDDSYVPRKYKILGDTSYANRDMIPNMFDKFRWENGSPCSTFDRVGLPYDAKGDARQPNDGIALWYTFTPEKDGFVNMNTCSSGFDTTITVYENPDQVFNKKKNYFDRNYLACNDDSSHPLGTCYYSSNLDVFLSAGHEYLVRIGGYNYESGDFSLYLEYLEPQPYADPDNARTLEVNQPQTGDMAEADIDLSLWYTFTPAVSSAYRVVACTSDFDSTLTVYNGDPLDGGAQIAYNDDLGDSIQSVGCGELSSHLLVNMVVGNTYYIKVSDFGAGNIHNYSTYGTFDIEVTDRPINDECEGAIRVTDFNVTGEVYTGNNSKATSSTDASGNILRGDCYSQDQGIFDVWYVYTPRLSGEAVFSLMGSNFDTAISLYDGCGGDLLACNDDTFFYSIWYQQSELSYELEAGNRYYIRVSGWGEENGVGDYNLKITGGGGDGTEILEILAADNKYFAGAGGTEAIATGQPVDMMIKARGGFPDANGLYSDWSITLPAGTISNVQEVNGRQYAAPVDGALGVNGTDKVMLYDLPFEENFPFFGEYYSKIYISSNGFIRVGQGPGASLPNNSTEALIANKVIAPLWDDYGYSDSGDKVFDIYVSQMEDPDCVVVTWVAQYYGDGASFNGDTCRFSATLCANGDIYFDYGSMDPAGVAGDLGTTPTVGISAGTGLEGDYILYAPYSFEQGDIEYVYMSGKTSIMFPASGDTDLELPAGLTPEIVNLANENYTFIGDGKFVDADGRVFDGGIRITGVITDDVADANVEYVVELHVQDSTGEEIAQQMRMIVIPELDMSYLEAISENWLGENCGAKDWCGQGDLNGDQKVDMRDVAILATFLPYEAPQE